MVLSSALRYMTLITVGIFNFLCLVEKHRMCRYYLLSHFTDSVHHVGDHHARVSEEAFWRSTYPGLSLRSFSVPLHLHQDLCECFNVAVNISRIQSSISIQFPPYYECSPSSMTGFFGGCLMFASLVLHCSSDNNISM